MKNHNKSIRQARKGTYDNITHAVHTAIKHHSGGFDKFAKQYGRNASTVANQWNINHENQPTYELFLEAVEYLNGEPVVMNAVCYLANGRFEKDLISINGNDIDAVLDIIAAAGELIHEGAEAVTDGRISHSERQALRGKLNALSGSIDTFNGILARGNVWLTNNTVALSRG